MYMLNQRKFIPSKYTVLTLCSLGWLLSFESLLSFSEGVASSWCSGWWLRGQRGGCGRLTALLR